MNPSIEACLPTQGAANIHTALFAGGCFWCVEAVFQRVRGVIEADPGYVWMEAGVPAAENLERMRACRMEVVRVRWDPERVRLKDLLDIFYATSSPTLVPWTWLGEFAQVRSGLFFEDAGDRTVAQQHLNELKTSEAYSDPVMTQILAMPHFEPAPESDRNFYLRNPRDGFCRTIVAPKLARLLQRFPEHHIAM